MTLDLIRWPEADALLDRALELPEHQRQAFVQRAAAHDPELLLALKMIVGEATRHDGFLEPGGALSGPLGTEIGRALADAPSSTLLQTGMRLDHYEIVSLLGRGGMGEVYRARDTRLVRDVALKVLPARFARDAERVARFRREAQVLASLNHPGIGSIYGLTETDGADALVLELVEGPTLAERLEAGPLSVDETISMGRQLAEALEAAHAQGILHRDLKPGNIKLTADGGVKILDFGLGKALTATPNESGVGADLTGAAPGSVLGTAAYMSPEQVRGDPLDQRSDIWAFGCVIFEMLTGTRAFRGRSVPEVLSHVLEQEPAFGLLPASTPPPLRRLLRRTLDKNPRRRLGYIGDALLEFDDAVVPMLEPIAPAPRGRRQAWLLLAAAAAAVLVALVWPRPQPDAPSAPPPARFVVPLADGDVPVTGFEPMPALSPDGRTIVYAARRSGVTQLFRRDLNDLDARPIDGTRNGKAPFFSPDGTSIGFVADGLLKRVALAGGISATICPAPGDVTATWSAADEIFFATTTSRVLQRVPASGGTPVPMTTLDPARGEQLHLLPQALPDGETLLFTIASDGGHHIATLRLADGEKTVVIDGSHGRFLSSGHLVFWRNEALWAAAFDPADPAGVGTPIRVMGDIEHAGDRVLHFDVAADGSMVYLPAGSLDVPPQRLAWIDRIGRQRPIELEPRPYLAVDVAPDGNGLALAIREQGNTDIWVANPKQHTMSQLTVDASSDEAPVWTRDGRFVVFRSDREPPGVFRRDAQASGQLEPVATAAGMRGHMSLTPDGRALLWSEVRPEGHVIVRAGLEDGRATIVVASPTTLLDPRISPDGRWLAYQSDESGSFEIYVIRLPDRDRPLRVSLRGGRSPRWSVDGGELFFLDETGLMSARFNAGAAAPGIPVRLFPVKPFDDSGGADYVVSRDGSEFLFILESGPTRAARLVLVQQWVAEVLSRFEQNGPSRLR